MSLKRMLGLKTGQRMLGVGWGESGEGTQRPGWVLPTSRWAGRAEVSWVGDGGVAPFVFTVLFGVCTWRRAPAPLVASWGLSFWSLHKTLAHISLF